jgi:hypothetical protein
VPDQSIWQVKVSARRHGNLTQQTEIASFHSQQQLSISGFGFVAAGDNLGGKMR